jgi:hypothetical protein
MGSVDYSEGDRVRVISGPFEGRPGTVIGPSDWFTGKLNVDVDVFGRSSAVVLAPDDLEPYNGAPGSDGVREPRGPQPDPRSEPVKLSHPESESN